MLSRGEAAPSSEYAGIPFCVAVRGSEFWLIWFVAFAILGMISTIVNARLPRLSQPPWPDLNHQGAGNASNSSIMLGVFFSALSFGGFLTLFLPVLNEMYALLPLGKSSTTLPSGALTPAGTADVSLVSYAACSLSARPSPPFASRSSSCPAYTKPRQHGTAPSLASGPTATRLILALSRRHLVKSCPPASNVGRRPSWWSLCSTSSASAPPSASRGVSVRTSCRQRGLPCAGMSRNSATIETACRSRALLSCGCLRRATPLAKREMMPGSHVGQHHLLTKMR